MLLDNFIKTLKELKENNIFLLTLSGGEPFLHPQINQILYLAHEYFNHVSILSNGTVISKEHLNAINKISESKGNFNIQISLDSIDSEINNETRGMTLLVLDNIKKLKRNGARITIAIVITSRNINSIVHTIRALAMMTNHFHIMPFRTVPYLKGNDTYLGVPIKKMNMVWKKIINLKQELNLQISTPLDDVCNSFKTSARGAPCMAGFTKLTIDPNLNIRPCDKCVEAVVGNLGASSLRDVWDGPLLADVYQRKTIYCISN